MRVRFHDLTPEERALICNGCGPKGGIMPVPEMGFSACCDHHDFNYWLGYSEFDRIRADWQFRDAMMADADKKPWWRRWWYRWMADLYYRAVRRWGMSAFYYGDRYRTREDLDAELARLRDGG